VPATFAILLVALSVTGDNVFSPATPAEADETTSTIYWGGPGGYYTVPAFSQPSTLTFFVQKPCTDCYITSVTPDLECDTAGPPWGDGPWATSDFAAPCYGMLHHMVLFNHAYMDPTCGHNSNFNLVGDRWFASGNERGTLTFPAGYGYYMPSSVAAPQTINWNLNVMIHNLGAEKAFRLAMNFKYRPATDFVKPVRHIWLDTDNCSDSQFPVPIGYSDTHWDWTSGSDPGGTYDDIEGTIIGIGGHVHDFGISVSAQKVQTGEFICTSDAGYAQSSPYAPLDVAAPPRPNDAGHSAGAVEEIPGDSAYNGHIESMSACSSNVKIGPGDTIRLHSQYNPDEGYCDSLPASCLDDVMGIMGAWLYDNCPNVVNVTQADGDSDLIGDACDACPADDDCDDDRCPVMVPAPDPACALDGNDPCLGNPDCDGDSNRPPGYSVCSGPCPGGYSRDGVELWVGTSPTDRCADTGPPGTDDEVDDKWPPDYNDDQAVNALDFVRWKQQFPNPGPLTTAAQKRSDLNAGNAVNALDFSAWKAYFPSTCVP
jgi:hypothetical protein